MGWKDEFEPRSPDKRFRTGKMYANLWYKEEKHNRTATVCLTRVLEYQADDKEWSRYFKDSEIHEAVGALMDAWINIHGERRVTEHMKRILKKKLDVDIVLPKQE